MQVKVKTNKFLEVSATGNGVEFEVRKNQRGKKKRVIR